MNYIPALIHSQISSFSNSQYYRPHKPSPSRTGTLHLFYITTLTPLALASAAMNTEWHTELCLCPAALQTSLWSSFPREARQGQLFWPCWCCFSHRTGRCAPSQQKAELSHPDTTPSSQKEEKSLPIQSRSALLS